MADRRCNDEQYKRVLEELFQSLREEDRKNVVARIPKESCQSLADRLLQNDEMMAALNRQDVPYPASEIIDVWARKSRSTIYVLKDTLEKLHLDAAVEALERAREDLVSLHTKISHVGISGGYKTYTVPSGKPLLEIIRPIIHRQQFVTSKQVFQMIQLVRSKNDRERELEWSSPAKHFKGQQVNIEVRKLEETQRHTDKAGNLDEKFRVGVDRNAISVIEEERLVFGYYDEDDGDRGFAKAIQCIDRLSIKMAEDAPLTEKRVCEERVCQERVCQERVCQEREQRNLEGNDDNSESTICQCIDLSSEDTLKDHLTAEGDFVVQQIQSEGHSTLNLSVRHGTHILRYPIMKQCDNGSERFSISGADHESADVHQLVSHYQTGGHCLPLLPSLPPTQVEEDPVYLKRNRNTSTDYRH